MELTFFDFCSGIGAGRIGLENNNFKCVGHSEIDESAIKTYDVMFGSEKNYGDLMNIEVSDLPEFDLMIAGFPCQTFSINGKRDGFNDERGNIIFGLIKILKAKKIKYFILENVKGLINHDNGNTFTIIKNLLVKAGYDIFFDVLNSNNYGVLQKRERIYIVGFLKELNVKNFTFPLHLVKNNKALIKSIIEFENTHNNFDENDITFKKYLSNKYNRHKNINIDLLKKQKFIIDTRQSDIRFYDSYFPTLRKGRHGLLYVFDQKIKKLNGIQSFILQGIPKKYAKKILKSDIANNTLLSQAGNAMTVNVIDLIAKKMREIINNGQ